MFYESTKYNMISLLSSVGYMKSAQLVRFFDDAPDSQNLIYYIKQQVDEKNFIYHKEKDLLQYRRYPDIKYDVLSKRVRSLWVLAAFRSHDVRQVFLLPYPREYMFITSDNTCYDVMCVESLSIAQVAYASHIKSTPRDVPDEVNHIAVVSNVDFGRRLDAYGFDSYCTLDANHTPQYYVWEDPDEDDDA